MAQKLGHSRNIPQILVKKIHNSVKKYPNSPEIYIVGDNILKIIVVKFQVIYCTVSKVMY